MTDKLKPYRPMRWLFLSAIVLALDVISKQAALHFLQPYQPLAIFPGFNLTLAFNRGVAFSLLSSGNAWQQWLLIIANVVILFIFAIISITMQRE